MQEPLTKVLVNKIFKNLIGKTMEVYVDDMLVKSLDKADHIKHLQEAFEVLRHHKMMLNPTKCAFRCRLGKVFRPNGLQAGYWSQPR